MKKHYNTLQGFSERLKEIMENKNINCVQLGKLIGMERKTIYTWINGYSMPNSLILARMCTNLNISADYLLFGKG